MKKQFIFLGLVLIGFTTAGIIQQHKAEANRKFNDSMNLVLEQKQKQAEEDANFRRSHRRGFTNSNRPAAPGHVNDYAAERRARLNTGNCSGAFMMK